MKSDWERPIQFEGTTLPGKAIAIDHLGMYGNLPEMSPATSEWLWRFTICVGRVRSCESKIVLHHAGISLALMRQHRARLLQTVPKHYVGSFDATVLDEWESALETMIEIAAGRKTCSWIAPPTEAEIKRNSE